MNFQLKPTDLAGVCSEKCDALIVLFLSGFDGFGHELSSLIASAHKTGDVGKKPGNSLHLFKPSFAKAKRLVVVCAGDGSPKQVRQAVTGAFSALGSAKNVVSATLHFAFDVTGEALFAGMTGADDATYVYTTTKSQPAEGRLLKQLTVSPGKDSHVADSFERAVAVIKGVELAKEWANRPANSLTTILLPWLPQTRASIRKRCATACINLIARRWFRRSARY